jgi:Flp pilus assembly CpaF family ATPase
VTATPQPLEELAFFKDTWAGDVALPFATAKRGTGPETTATTDVPNRHVQDRPTFGPPPSYVDEIWDQGLDWGLIKELRAQASNEISQLRPNHASEEEEQALGRRVIAQIVDRMLAREMQQGTDTSQMPVGLIQEAIFDALFGLGRLQKLIDSKWIENIEIHGAGTVHIELIDGTLCDGPAIADSNQELIEDLQFWAARTKGTPRPFSPANPTLNLALGEGARLAAMAWVTLQPIVTIRLHRMVDVGFDDLIAKGTLTPLMANLLSAVVQSGSSIVVSGAQGAGKTTLCRALCAALPPSERIITFETDRELHLEMMPDKHPRVFSVEARSGSGEFRPDGREAGEFEIIQGLREALRHNADRLLVGEVRGGEIIAMIQAMQSGTGSISTTHARSARDTYNKLVTCCLEVNGITESYATRAIASSINFVAFIKKVQITDESGRTHRVRRVTEIVALEQTTDGVAFSDVFTTSGADGIARAHTLPPYVEDLVEAGFDQHGFVVEANTHRREGK